MQIHCCYVEPDGVFYNPGQLGRRRFSIRWSGGGTFPRITPCSVTLEQLGTILVYTFPLHLSNASITVLPLAPRPIFPLTRRTPKKLSSTSMSPESGDFVSHSSAIISRISVKVDTYFNRVTI